MQYLLFAVKSVKIVANVVILLLGLRLILKLFGASADIAIVSWIYDLSYIFISFLDKIFTNPQFAGRFIIDLATLFGIIIYGFIAYLITEFLESMIYRSGGSN